MKVGVFRRVLEELAADLQERGGIDLREAALASLFIRGMPEKLVGDKAYDGDTLVRKSLKKYSVKLIAPHHRNRTKAKTQDGRKVRRHKRHWNIERILLGCCKISSG